jgi:hypothetical protein
VILDTDSVFHGVDRVEEGAEPLPALRPGMQLAREGPDRWRVGPAGGGVLARYGDGDLRFSISWKAYCFADEAEERAAHEHSDDVTREQAFETLLGDLRGRGRLGRAPESARDLALRLVDEYVKFPPARAEAA